MDAAAAGIAGHQVVFVDTNLDTHLVVVVSPADTVSILKQKLLSEHKKCFPEVKDIKINALKVKRKGHYYHLPDSMPVHSAFVGVKTNCFLFAEASSGKGNSRPSSNRKNLQLSGPSKDVAVVVYGLASDFVSDQARDLRVRDADQLGGDDLRSLTVKEHDTNEGNGQSSLTEISKKPGDDKPQEFQPLDEKDEARDESKEGNSKSCSTDVSVLAEENFEAGHEGKKKRMQKKRMLTEIAPMNNDVHAVDLPEKDIMPVGAEVPTFGSTEKGEHELSTFNNDADVADLPEEDVSPDGVETPTIGNIEKKGEHKVCPVNNDADDPVLREEESLPDGIEPTFGSLQEGDDELATRNGPGEGDVNLGSSHQEMGNEHGVEDQLGSIDADSPKGAQKKKGKRKKRSEAASNNVIKDHHPLTVLALRATTVLGKGPTETSEEFIGKVIEDVVTIGKVHQENSQSLEGVIDNKSNDQLEEVLQESVPEERHEVENRTAAREDAEVRNELLPDSTLRKEDSAAGEMPDNELRSKDKNKKKRKGKTSDSVNLVIPSVPSARTGENGGEEIVNNDTAPAPVEEKNEDRTDLKGTDASVSNASNIVREIRSASAASLSGGKKTRKRKKNADDAAAGSHQSSPTDNRMIITSPEVVHDGFDGDNDSSHDVARTLLHLSGNNGAETMEFEHEKPTSEEKTVKENGDADFSAAAKRRKSKKAKKSIMENKKVSDLETISTVATHLPLDKSDEGIFSSEAGNTSALHGVQERLDGDATNVEVPLGIHDELEEDLENEVEKNNRKSKKKKPRAASVVEEAPMAGHDVKEPEGNPDTDGGQKENIEKQRNTTASTPDRCVDGEADETRANTEEEPLPLSQIKQPLENLENKSKKKRTKSQNSVRIDTTADDIVRKTDEVSHIEAEPQRTAPLEKPEENPGEADDARSNREEEPLPLSQLKQQPLEKLGNKSKKKRTKSQNSVMTDTTADAISRKTDDVSHIEAEPQRTAPLEKPEENPGEAGDARSNREEEPLPLSQFKQPLEKLGNKSKKKRTKSQNSVMSDTTVDDIGRKTDEVSHNEAEPQRTSPVEKPEENLENEKAKKQTRRKLKLSAGDSSHSLLEESDNLQSTASLNEMSGDMGTDKITMKIKPTEASFVDEGTETEPSHPQGIDAITSGYSLPANGISDLGHQKNAPKKRGGSKGKSHGLNSISVLDDGRQEVASDEVPVDLGKKAKKLGVNEVFEHSSLCASSDGQGFSKPNHNVVSEKTTTAQNGEPILPSNLKTSGVSAEVIGSPRPRANPIDVAPNEKRQLRGKSNKRTNSVDINDDSGAPVAKRRNPDRKVQPGKMKIDQYRVSYRKPSDKGITEVLKGSQGKKTLPGKSASLFQDASSASSEDESVAASSNSSTKSPDDNMYSSDDSEVSSEAVTKIIKPAAPSKGGGIATLLRRSARYKKAQLNASQSQQEEEDSQDVEMVPESEPIM